MMVSAPGFQPAGQTSPCLSVYMNAWARCVMLRRVSYCRLCVLENAKPELGGEFHPHFFQQGDHSWWFAWKGVVEIQTQKNATIIHKTPQSAGRIDDEKSSQSVTILLQVDTVVLADGVGEVGEERDVQLAKTTLGPWGGHPGKVGEVGVNWAGYHLELGIQRPVR